MAHLDLQVLQRIIVDAASAHTVGEQVAMLVSDVRKAMEVGVCSLYRRTDDETLTLVANEGFRGGSVGRIVLPVGEGLIGTIAREQQPLNLARAHEHPAFKRFADSGEDDFPAFLGVPILHLGELLGVLAVQDALSRGFTDDEESFLITVAVQLGAVLLRLDDGSVQRRPGSGQRTLTGLPAASGKAIGRVHLVVNDKTLGLLDEPASKGVRAELSVLEQAIEATMHDIDAAKDQLTATATSEALELYDFYKAMLAGDQLVTAAERRVQEGASAFAAVRASIDEHVRAFEAIDNEYLQARSDDVRHVGNALLMHIIGEKVSAPDVEDLVLLGTTVSITDMGALRPDQIAAVVCLEGSQLSHMVVLARSLGIPAVVGLGPVDQIQDGARVVVDGDIGTVIFNPDTAVEAAYRGAIATERNRQATMLEEIDLPSITRDGKQITLLANTGLLADARPGKERGAQGVGLYRSEIPFLTASTFPSEVEQYATYRELLEIYHPLPVVMRTLDVGGDKQLPFLTVDEDNPALGWRGIRFALDNTVVFATQVRAMIRAAVGLNNLRIMLPMVSSVSEFIEAERVVRAAVEEVTQSEPDARMPPLGIMIEVPAVVGLLPHFAARVDFVSIGTNDLTQYLLAVDRGNPRVVSCYDHLHPGVLNVLGALAKGTRELRMDVSICGEMAADPHAVALLMGMGYRTFSLNAHSLPLVKRVVRQLSQRNAARLVARIGKMGSAESVREAVARALVRWGVET